MRTFTTVIALLAGAVVAGAVAAEEEAQTRLVDAPSPSQKTPYRVWPSRPPAGCPFNPSDSLVGVAFTGRHAEYAGADTWYPSWASDGNLYSPWTDGNVNGTGCGSGGKDAATGNAKIVGDDPLKLQIVEQGTFKSDPTPYAGRYPCGSLVHNGVWYYGTYCLHPSAGILRDGVNYNWPWMGPFPGFRWSTDSGRTWRQTPGSPARPLFGESALHGEPVKIGAPHFVDFGKNLEHSPDGKAYLVAQGASHGPDGRRYAYDSWITADEAYLIRVKPTIENMNDASKYEFCAGPDAWTGDFAKIRPIAAWKDNMGCVTMTYDAPLKKYLMCVTDGGNTISKFNTYLLESDRVSGPWKLVAYLKHLGEQAYFVNVPSKFIGADGRTLWLCYSANFTNGYLGTAFRSDPPGSGYGMCLQEVRLLAPSDPVPEAGPLDREENIAREAEVTVSSVHPGYSAAGAVDGVVDGFPGDVGHEWASNGESRTAMIRLTWDEEQAIDRVWLFDRPNKLDQVKAGMLIFSDGTTIKTGELPDDAQKGLEVKFAPKKARWLIFAVDAVKPGSPNIGLSEIAVFRAP